jgi:hypothetical protein
LQKQPCQGTFHFVLERNDEYNHCSSSCKRNEEQKKVEKNVGFGLERQQITCNRN